MPSSNSLEKNTTDFVLRKFLKPMKSKVVTLNTVDRQLYSNPGFNPQTGNTLQVKRPHQFVTARTSGGDISGTDPNDLVSATATATVQDMFTFHVDWSIIEEALYLDQKGDGSSNTNSILGPALEKMLVDVEIDLNKYIKNTGAHFLGTVDTAISKWSDIAQVGSFAKALGWGSGKVFTEVGPYAVQDLADVQKGIYSKDLAEDAWKEAMIPTNFGGVIAYMSNTLPKHNVGDHDGGLQLQATPTQTYSASKDTYLTTLVLKGCDTSVTGFLKKGDVIRVDSKYWNQLHSKEQAAGRGGAGLSYTATVTADANSDGSGFCTVIVSGPAISDASVNNQYDTISSALAVDDNVTVLSGTASGSTVPNLFYHEQAYSIHSVQLPKLYSLDNSVLSLMGMSFRAVRYSDGDANRQKLRIDYLPAYACNNPLLAGRFYGV